MTIDAPTFATVFALLIVLAILLIWRSLRKLQSAPDNGYDWHDLLMENGRASKAAHVLMGAFSVTTWYFIYAALSGKMTETLFGLYAATWIAPVIARLFAAPVQEANNV